MEVARDCVRFLKPLRPHILKITDCQDFVALPESFGPLMQTMLLVWRHSRHFKTATKLLALMKRLANALIGQAHLFLPGLASGLLMSARVWTVSDLGVMTMQLKSSLLYRSLAGHIRTALHNWTQAGW